MPRKDFGFGAGRSGGFQKTGDFLSPSNLAFDDSDWKPVDLPHDWAIELPFKNDPALASKGFYPLGRDYPETSVGWYRRVFDLPASDAGRRISLEFDGAYREAMVVFNGFYIGRHSGGYDPFSFDVTDFALPGGPNVLLVRVDATLSDGWFYEGAGIYRHVWLVKTAPVHVKKWGTLAAAKVQPGAGHGLHPDRSGEPRQGRARTCASSRPFSIPPARRSARPRPRRRPVAELGERTYEQQVVVTAAGAVVARAAQPVQAGHRGGIRRRRHGPLRDPLRHPHLQVRRGQGLLPERQARQGQGHLQPPGPRRRRRGAARRGAVLPRRKLQEMGCNAFRTSHNPPTPELLDACDELGMLVLDETRMMSSNPEGLGQFENVVRRDRNHPSVFMWSMGNEEGVATTETGLQILTAMKAVPH